MNESVHDFNEAWSVSCRISGRTTYYVMHNSGRPYIVSQEFAELVNERAQLKTEVMVIESERALKRAELLNSKR